MAKTSIVKKAIFVIAFIAVFLPPFAKYQQIRYKSITLDRQLKSLKEEIKKLEEEIDQLKEIEELRRVRLTEAMKDEKVLEKLKEKRKYDHDEDSKHEEVLTLDEISQMRFTKKKITQ